MSRILIVEDETHLAEGLRFNLEAEGYRTHLESDGNSALAWLLNPPEQPAAVLLDTCAAIWLVIGAPMSPRSSRTHLPSLRSIAGKRIIAALD